MNWWKISDWFKKYIMEYWNKSMSVYEFIIQMNVNWFVNLNISGPLIYS